MKLFKYIFLSVASALILMLGGCEKRPSKYRIGVSQCNSDDWRTQMNNEMRREAMFNDDVTLEIRSADDNTEQQIEDIQYFIDSGFDLIIVSPRESAPITPVVKEAFDKGIPVITFDRRIDGESYSAFQGADNTDMGRAVGEWVASRLGESGKIFEIVGLAGSSPATERHNGFMEVIGKYPGLSVVTAESDWTAKRASVVADSVLRRHPDIDLIFAQNDRMAISARHEADKLGLKGITIVGIDAVPETGIKAVEDGTINATFLYPSGGDRIIQTACNILKDRHYERNAILPTGEVIDSTNASILLLQAEGIAGQTTKMERLKSRIDEYWARHSIQTTLLYSVGIILVLAIILIIIGSKAYWMRVRHQQALSLQNAKLEEQRDRLIELQKQVEEATHAKLVFFTNVSHDLRTPLTLISDPIDQIKDADNLTPRQHTLMQLADKNVNVLLRLINQILDFRKYENGKMDFTPVDVDMRQCLTSWAESFKGLSLKTLN